MVECQCLDEILREERLARLDVLKLDVEGFERQVLEGARSTIESSHPAILVEVNAVETLDFLSPFGYRFYGIARRRSGFTELVGVDPQDDLGAFSEYPETGPNVLALHPSGQFSVRDGKLRSHQ
jgi:hypothetical protein